MIDKIINFLIYVTLLIIFVLAFILRESLLINLIVICLLLDRISREKKQ